MQTTGQKILSVLVAATVITWVVLLTRTAIEPPPQKIILELK